MDFLYLLLIIVFFALLAGFVRVCENTGRRS
jgi:hypothetical protein